MCDDNSYNNDTEMINKNRFCNDMKRSCSYSYPVHLHILTDPLRFLLLLASYPYPHLSILFFSIIFYSILFHSTLFYSILLYSTLLYPTLLYSTLLYSTVLYSTLLYSSPT